MTSDDYRRALDAALREQQQLSEQQRATEQRLAQLSQTIGTLTRLCGGTPQVSLGLTDACRSVLRAAGVPLTAVQVRDRLVTMGFDTAQYANDLAAIHTVLKRLSEASEARVLWHTPVAGEQTKPTYLWTPYEWSSYEWKGPAGAAAPKPARRRRKLRSVCMMR